MPPYILLQKRIGQTPLQALTEWRTLHPEYAEVPATYAGRLDPMASGALLVLLGEECKHQERYRGLDKEYDIEVLLGIGSDTGDILGIVEPGKSATLLSEAEMRKICNAEIGTHTVPYPAFSSKTVNGTPLFRYALEGTLSSIEAPVHDETIHSIELTDISRLSTQALRARIEGLLALAPRAPEASKELGADFRIAQVRESWSTIWEYEREWSVIRLSVHSASGTYMRSLAERIGAHLGTRALALSIHRKSISLP